MLERTSPPRDWDHAELARRAFPGLAAASQQHAQPHRPAQLLRLRTERTILTAANAMVGGLNTRNLGELDKQTSMTCHGVGEIDANTPDEPTLGPVDAALPIAARALQHHAVRVDQQ